LTRVIGEAQLQPTPAAKARSVTGCGDELVVSPNLGPQPLRDEVASVVGQTATLIGWLSFLIDDRGQARSYWSVAHKLSQEFNDQGLA
jgi:hypothetical protein